MTAIDQQHGWQDIASTLAETESMWLSLCNGVNEDRTEMLIDALIEQHGLVMQGESNADALIALIGFLSHQVIAFHEQSDVTLQSSMMLMQMGLQRAVNASIVLKTRKRTDA